MRRKEFEREVLAALAEAPPEWAPLLRDVAILVEDEPDADTARDGEVFGIFEGSALSERAAGFNYDPPRITLFRRPLGRAFRTRRQRRREIRRTVLHELAHYLGAAEADMPPLGLE